MCEAEGYGMVREFVGHGIGKTMHEDPQLPNYGEPGKGPRLRAGMVLAIEPMINLGGPDVKVLEDGWTAITIDGSPACTLSTRSQSRTMGRGSNDALAR